MRTAWPCVVVVCCGVAVSSSKMGGRCVLSFKMDFWVCGSGGAREVHVISCTRVVQMGMALYVIWH